MEEAFAGLLKIEDLPADLRDNFIQLAGQYKHQEKQVSLGLRSTNTERNRIIYGLLSLLSTWEQRQAHNKRESKKAAALSDKERQLARAYQVLGRLQTRNPIDIFFDHFIRNDPNLFQHILSEEPSNRADLLFAKAITDTDFDRLVSPLDAHTWRTLLLDRQKKNPSFVNGWLDYHQYREQYADKLETLIGESKRSWQRLLKTSSIGMLLGSIGAAVFQDPLEQLLRDYESGIDPEDTNDDGDELMNEDGD